jgi:hypothetical protein
MNFSYFWLLSPNRDSSATQTLLLVLGIFLFSQPILANEAEAELWRKRAVEQENRAEQESDPWRAKMYRETAARFYENAEIAQKNHYVQDPVLVDRSILRESRKTQLTGTGFFFPGTWEFSIGRGDGEFVPTPGPTYFTDPETLAVTGIYEAPRSSLIYDNLLRSNNETQKDLYLIRPLQFRFQYWSPTDSWGISLENRRFGIEPGGNYGFDIFRFTGLLDYYSADYNWNETKLNFSYRDNFSLDQSFVFLYGLRGIRTDSQNLIYPFNEGGVSSRYQETTRALGPNLGIQYIQNFWGFFLFTVGAEVSLGRGDVSYERFEIFESPLSTGPRYFFSNLRSNDSVRLTTLGGELYTRYQFKIFDSDLIGISIHYHHFSRDTEADLNRLPEIISNLDLFARFQLAEYFVTNYLYNETFRSRSNIRSHTIRWVQWEFTHAF